MERIKIQKIRQLEVEEPSRKQTKGEAQVISAYEKFFPEMKENLKKMGVEFRAPKVLVNEKELDLGDYVHDHALRTHFPFGHKGVLPYYYVGGESDGRLFYVGGQMGFYDYEKKTIVVDLNRIRQDLAFYKEGDFARANGVTKQQERRFLEMRIREVLETTLPEYIVGQKLPYSEIKRDLKLAIESKISKSKREEIRDSDIKGRTFENIAKGISFAAEKVVASFTLKKSLKELLEGIGPEDYMSSQYEICKLYDARLPFLANLLLNEARIHREAMVGYEREESLSRSLSDYVNFSSYPYWLTYEGIGVFFAAMIIEKYKEKAPQVATSPQLLIEKLNSLSKRDFDKYSHSDYYSPSDKGRRVHVLATTRRNR